MDRSKRPSDPATETGRRPTDLERLLALIERLRAPDGCPWDREQTLPDLRAYLVEEAHEAAAAIDAGDWDALEEELGDLLFQVAFIGRLGAEQGHLELGRAIDRVHAKMVERHPHVFGPGGSDDDFERPADAAAMGGIWERAKAARSGRRSILAGVPTSLPALVGAYRMTQKAAGVGFDWPDAAAVVDKLHEELAELEEARTREGADSDATDARRAAVREELGDLLFTVANLSRHLGVDPEAALAAANLKFRRRFETVEGHLAEAGEAPAEVGLDRLEELWRRVKDAEGASGTQTPPDDGSEEDPVGA